MDVPLRKSSFFQNCGTFCFDLFWKYHNFERNEIRATGFLKWRDFRECCECSKIEVTFWFWCGKSVFRSFFGRSQICLEINWPLVHTCTFIRQMRVAKMPSAEEVLDPPKKFSILYYVTSIFFYLPPCLAYFWHAAWY